MEYITIALLLIAGLILIILEILILPGMVVGFIGVLLLIVSVIIAFREAGFEVGILLILAILFLIIILFYIMKKLKVLNRFILDQENKIISKNLFNSSQTLIGETGIALTDLKPSGFILIENRKYDALSEAEFILKDSKVKVISLNAFKLVVKKIEE
ncbi:MAG: NfeD family protein [Ignavibacteria bacterium]